MFYSKHILLLFLALFISTEIFCQTDDLDIDRFDTTLNRVILRYEKSGGLLVHTGGFGAIFRKAHNVNYFRKDLWEIEFTGMQSEKQVRINLYGTYYSNANSYIYGKLNKVYMLHTGLGQQHLLNSKPYWGGVEVRFTYYGGASLAIAKPIYLYIIIDQTNFNFLELESQRYDPEKHFIDNIYGRAPFLDGLGKTKFYPGIYGKAGLNFEYGEYNQMLKSLELGIMAEGYPFPIPMMAFSPSRYHFINFYLNVTFGKRFNKY
jgi:hypothetical protein